MVVNFPVTDVDDPNYSHTHTEPNGVTWTWDGEKWRVTNNSSDGGGGAPSDINLQEVTDNGAITDNIIDFQSGAIVSGGQLQLPGGGNDTDALQRQEVVSLINSNQTVTDGRYLRLDVDAAAQSVESTAGVSYKGLTTHEGGVSVTGGPAIFSSENITSNGQAFGIDLKPTLTDNRQDIHGCDAEMNLANNDVTRNVIYYNARGTINTVSNGGSTTGVTGFQVNSGIGANFDNARVLGFKTNLSADGNRVYNIFSDNTAPNYFFGDIQCGGIHRNLLPEKEESTITAVSGVVDCNNQDVLYSISYAAGGPQNVTDERISAIGFQVNSTFGSDYEDGAREAYGFRSNMPVASNGKTFNIFSDGTAPNYFAGDITSIGSIYVNTSNDFPGIGNTDTGAVINSTSSGSQVIISQEANIALYCNRNASGIVAEYRLMGLPRGEVVVSSGGCTWNSKTSFSTRDEVPEFADATQVISQLKAGRDGFSAEDIQAHLPTDWAHESEGQVMFDNTRLIPVLTKALQEALTEIDTLKTRLSDAGIA